MAVEWCTHCRAHLLLTQITVRTPKYSMLCCHLSCFISSDATVPLIYSRSLLLLSFFHIASALRLYENIEQEAGDVLPKFYSETTTAEFQKSKVHAVFLYIKQLLSNLENKIDKFAGKATQ